MALALALILCLSFSVGAFAQDAEPEVDEKNAPAAQASTPVNTQDDNILEIGVWYVVNYPAGISNLPATAPDALGLRNKLTSTCRVRIPIFGCISNWPTPRWVSRFAYGNSNAWEKDWKRAAAGGWENNYIDTVDLAYFAGHGSSNALWFGVGSQDDAQLTHQDAFRSWGDRDLDWVGIAACNVLDNPNLGNWANAMNGLRLILGYQTVMADVAHGEWFGEYIRLNYTLPQAWFKASDKLQPQGVVARVVAEEQWMYNDRWSNHASQDYRNNTYWFWTYKVGSEPARRVNLDEVTEMPVYEVAPLALSEVNSRWDSLVSATGITTTDFITQTRLSSLDGRSVLEMSNPVRFSVDNKLVLHEGSGLFNYTNTDSLWVIPSEEERRGRAMMAISQEDARPIADNFLQNNGLLPADAQYYEVVSDILSQAVEPSPGRVGSGAGAILQEQITNHQVIYSRILNGTIPARDGRAAQQVDFSVMGPGSKLKVQIAAEVPTGLSRSALESEAVLGGLGGYRAVQQPVARGTNAPMTVGVLPFEAASKMVELNAQGQPELEAKFGLSYIPLAGITEREIVRNTLAYWEGPMGFEQSQLIPVHVIETRNVIEDSLDSSVVTATAYIPANPRYMAPLARILSGVATDQTEDGTVYTFTAMDANTTLAEAGYDAALDFVAGSGDYLYTWYVDSVAPDNAIGTGLTIQHTVPNPGNRPEESEEVGEGEEQEAVVNNPNRVILVVSDINPVSDAQSSQDSMSINFIFLPSLEAQ
jgi:hypothetical protein